MCVPTLDDLGSFFDWFKRERFDGVEGVICFETNKPGPVLGITACTHGNEPSGLAAIKNLLDINVQKLLKRGTIFLAVNNIRAAERYFSASTDEEKSKARSTDHNMNRLPEDMLSDQNSDRYEIVRAQALYPIWQKFTVGFDVHTTRRDSPPMIISGRDKFQRDLVRGFPIEIVISNIDVVQIGLPAFGFYGGVDSGIPVFEIEAGAHEKPESFRRAIECALALLKNLKMIEGRTKPLVDEYLEYFIDGSVVFSNNSYEQSRIFENFEFVSKGTIFATGDAVPVLRAPFDCHTIFCNIKLKPDTIAEEVMFLSRPVRKLSA